MQAYRTPKLIAFLGAGLSLAAFALAMRFDYGVAFAGKMVGVYSGCVLVGPSSGATSNARVFMRPIRNPIRWLPEVISTPQTTIVLFPLWIVVVLACSAGLALHWRSRRPQPGTCRRCGYDLTGNVSGVCPECGTAIQGKPEESV